MRLFVCFLLSCLLISCKESDLFPNSVKKEKVVLDGPSQMTLNERLKSNGSLSPYDLTLIDNRGRNLNVFVEAYDGVSILALRKSDNKRFVIQLDKLSEESSKHVIEKGQFNQSVVSDFLNDKGNLSRFEEAKKILNIDVLVDDSEESEQAIAFLREEKIRFYKEELTGASLKDKSMLKEWGVKGAPAFKIGERVIEGFNKLELMSAMIEAYEKKKK